MSSHEYIRWLLIKFTLVNECEFQAKYGFTLGETCDTCYAWMIFGGFPRYNFCSEFISIL